MAGEFFSSRYGNEHFVACGSKTIYQFAEAVMIILQASPVLVVSTPVSCCGCSCARVTTRSTATQTERQTTVHTTSQTTPEIQTASSQTIITGGKGITDIVHVKFTVPASCTSRKEFFSVLLTFLYIFLCSFRLKCHRDRNRRVVI